jgi:hypothetical protein
VGDGGLFQSPPPGKQFRTGSGFIFQKMFLSLGRTFAVFMETNMSRIGVEYFSWIRF